MWAQNEAIQKHRLTEAELDLKKASKISQAMEAATKQTMELQGAILVDKTREKTMLLWWRPPFSK